MTDKQLIEEVRAIAHYIDELLVRMDFEPEQMSKHERRVSTWYDRGDLHVTVSAVWAGELPDD